MDNPASVQELVQHMRAAIDEVIGEDKKLAATFKNMHQGYPDYTLERFLKARDYNVAKASKMLEDCLRWRVESDIDHILTRPVGSKETNDAMRRSHLIGMTGFCKKGRPVFALGVPSFDPSLKDKYVQSHIQINEYRDRVLFTQQTKRMNRFVRSCIKIFDMTGLKISTLSHLKILTDISTIDDLNYPEKTDTYYIVNAPYIFSACWKVVKPLLHERTNRKVKVLQGCGREELLKVMDYEVLPFFCKGGSKSSKGTMLPLDSKDNCYSSSHPFHVELWNYINQANVISRYVGPTPQDAIHVNVPDLREEVHTIESGEEMQMIESGEEMHMIDSGLELAMENVTFEEGESSEGSGKSSSDNNRGKSIES